MVDEVEPIPVTREDDDGDGATSVLVDRGEPTDSVDEVLARLDAPFVDVVETQRAVRKVKFDPIDDAIVLRCIELGLRGPTGSNGQNWEFIVVRDREIKEKFQKQYKRAWRVYGGIGHRVMKDNPTMLKVLDAVQWQVEHFADIPVVLVACLKGNRVPAVPLPAPMIPSSYYGSIYPSVQNVLLAARAMGLGASLITLPLMSTVYSRRVLGLPLSVTPACMVPLGWPRGRYGPTTRRPVGDVVHLDRFGEQPWK